MRLDMYGPGAAPGEDAGLKYHVRVGSYVYRVYSQMGVASHRGLQIISATRSITIRTWYI